MSKILKTAVLLLLTSFCTQNLHAQAISDADKKGIEACYHNFMAAFEKMDPAALGTLFTENAVNIDPTGKIVRGRSNIIAHYGGYMAYLKSQPKPDQMKTENTDWQNRYLAPDLISSTYTSKDILTFGDKVKEEVMSLSILLRKKGDQWLAELITLTPVVEMPGN